MMGNKKTPKRTALRLEVWENTRVCREDDTDCTPASVPHRSLHTCPLLLLSPLRPQCSSSRTVLPTAPGPSHQLNFLPRSLLLLWGRPGALPTLTPPQHFPQAHAVLPLRPWPSLGTSLPPERQLWPVECESRLGVAPAPGLGAVQRQPCLCPQRPGMPSGSCGKP